MQASAYIDKTGTTYKQYLELFLSRRQDLWGREEKPLGYNETITTTWSVAIGEIRQSRPQAAKLLGMFARFGSGSVEDYRSIASDFAGALSDLITFNDSIAALRSFSLIERNGDLVFVHPLVRKVVSDGFGEKFDKPTHLDMPGPGEQTNLAIDTAQTSGLDAGGPDLVNRGREPEPIGAVQRTRMGAIVTTKLDCPYPRCTSNGAPTFNRLPGGIGQCRSCNRLVVECREEGCRRSGTFNRPFVRHCRRCGERINQTAQWEKARSDGWDLVPQSVSRPEVIADLSGLADNSSSGSVAIATAMVRGALAVHHAGRFLALLRVVPLATGNPFLWELDRYPFPALPDGSDPAPYPPKLLPGERYLAYSCPQGVLVLDLWSCPGLSAKDLGPQYRLIRCQRRSLAAAPIPLDESRIGLLTRDRSGDGHFRWAVWDLSNKDLTDAELSSRLDSRETKDLGHLSWIRKSCRAELVDDRVIVFTTPRAQRIWRIEDAIASRFDMLLTIWPNRATKQTDSIILNEHHDDWASVGLSSHAFLLEPGAARFSCVICVEQDDSTSPVRIEEYEVDFDTLQANAPQSMGHRSGAVPIGLAPNPNKVSQMYFRVGTEIWSQTDGQGTSICLDGLPKVVVSLRLSGPLVTSVGENEEGERFIQIDSLRHRGGHAGVLVENRLLSEPLLWYHWLFTIEMDAENRLQACRRIVAFNQG